jgi:hypothetical protein
VGWPRACGTGARRDSAEPTGPSLSWTSPLRRASRRRPSTGGFARKRFIIETNGAGVALLDVDGDGWLDALVLNGTRLKEGSRDDQIWPVGESPTARLYRNRHDGTFADITRGSGLERVAWSSSVCAGDIDNDGRVDLFTTAYGTNVLYRNAGDGRFTDITARAGLPTTGTRWGSGCTFIDYDRDWPSRFVRRELPASRSRCRLRTRAGGQLPLEGYSRELRAKGPATDTNLLYHQERDGTFRDVSVESESPRCAIATR